MLEQLIPLFILAGIFGLYGIESLYHYVMEQREFTYYTKPHDWKKCKNLNPDGPTPCWHPHCCCQTKGHQ